jgi:hypothetical protein
LEIEKIDKNFELRWNNVLKLIEERFGEKPDITVVLFLIGVQELGKIKKKFSKDQKIEIMHVAVCTLLMQYGFYKFIGRDEEGCPHFEATEKLPFLAPLQQSKFIREAIVDYFEKE